MCRPQLIAAVLLAVLLFGCGKPPEPTTVPPPPKLEPKAEPKEEPSAKPVVLTPAQMQAEFKKDKAFLVNQHAGRTVEVTGQVNGLAKQKEKGIVGYLAIHAGGDSLTNVISLGIGTQEDMDKVRPGKTVTLHCKVPKKGESPDTVWYVVKVAD